MDLFKVIDELYREKQKLERIIESLEELEARPAHPISAPRRRGRKFMNAEERRIVSARMKAYWAERRAGKPKTGRTPGSGPAVKAS